MRLYGLRLKRCVFKFRNGPVPYTGNSSFRKYYRQIAYLPTRRNYCEFEIEEFDVNVKKRRRVLLDAWDDYNRFDADDRSWKRYRKTQWKTT